VLFGPIKVPFKKPPNLGFFIPKFIPPFGVFFFLLGGQTLLLVGHFWVIWGGGFFFLQFWKPPFRISSHWETPPFIGLWVGNSPLRGEKNLLFNPLGKWGGSHICGGHQGFTGCPSWANIPQTPLVEGPPLSSKNRAHPVGGAP